MEGVEISTATVLPEQHEDQLKLGFSMIERAFCAKVQALENEVKGLRVSCEEQKAQASAFQRKNQALEVELMEGHQKSQELSEKNKELFKEMQQLRRHLAKLEGLRKKVLESVSDEQQMLGGGGGGELEEDKLYMREAYASSSAPLTFPGGGGPAASQQPMKGPALDAYRAQTPPWAASPAPQEPVTAGAAAAYGAAPAPAGGMVDGKAFFREAKKALSYEAFNDFLSSIKRLNHEQQGREDTLEEARRIFGHEHQHLYKEFEQLLDRHAM